MAAHKLKVGQLVTLHSRRHGVWAEPFEIVRPLPHENGDFSIASNRPGTATSGSCLERACLGLSMEAFYRIVSQADGTFAVERTEIGKEPIVSGHSRWKLRPAPMSLT